MNAMNKRVCLVVAFLLGYLGYLPASNAQIYWEPEYDPSQMVWAADFSFAQQMERITITGYREWITVCAGQNCSDYFQQMTDARLTAAALSQIQILSSDQVAAMKKKHDIRCAPINSELKAVTSHADNDTRVMAVQAAFDSTFQRNAIADSMWDLFVFGVRVSLGLYGKYTFTATYADGGTEDYIVTNLTASVTIERKSSPPTLVLGSGQPQPTDCSVIG